MFQTVTITNYPIKRVNVWIMTIWMVCYKIEVKCDIWTL